MVFIIWVTCIIDIWPVLHRVPARKMKTTSEYFSKKFIYLLGILIFVESHIMLMVPRWKCLEFASQGGSTIFILCYQSIRNVIAEIFGH